MTNPTEKALPEFPERIEYKTDASGFIVSKTPVLWDELVRYERERADAWEARARLAKPALELAAMTIGCACACIRCKTASDRVYEALAAIGPLPELPPEGRE